jgi:hypothetical protein
MSRTDWLRFEAAMVGLLMVVALVSGIASLF